MRPREYVGLCELRPRQAAVAVLGRIAASPGQDSATPRRPTRSLHSRLQRRRFPGRAGERAEGQNSNAQKRQAPWAREKETAFDSFRPRTPGGPLKTFAGAGFLTSGLSARRGLPTCGPFPPGASGQWIVPLSFRIQWRGPCRPYTGLPFTTSEAPPLSHAAQTSVKWPCRRLSSAGSFARDYGARSPFSPHVCRGPSRAVIAI